MTYVTQTYHRGSIFRKYCEMLEMCVTRHRMAQRQRCQCLLFLASKDNQSAFDVHTHVQIHVDNKYMENPLTLYSRMGGESREHGKDKEEN